MRVKLKLFGPLKESAGFGEQWCEVLAGGSVADLLAVVKKTRALPEGLLAASAFAVNQEYVPVGSLLRDGDEVAILPPVSGGAE